MRPIDADEATQYANEHLLNAYAWLITSFLQNCATIDPVKHGRWIMRGGYFRCSACDAKSLLRNAGGTGGFREYDQVKSKYCPNCGARMDGGDIS